MNISAIIAEYNPLHKGHLYQIEKTKALTGSEGLVCIMSGNFVQRGEPAVVDKWSRTKMALLNGVDLVLELPVVYSLSSAEFFAHGAVTILNSLGVINNLCFGSEIGNMDILYSIASILCREPEEYRYLLRKQLHEGNAYPQSRAKALIEYISENRLLPLENINGVLDSSNNILGIEYCKSLIRNSSTIKPYTVRREGGAYNSEVLHTAFSSATAIRKILREFKNVELLRDHLPHSSYNIMKELSLNGYSFTFDSAMLPFIRYKCLQNPDSIMNLPDVSEGVHNRIISAAASSGNYQEMLSSIKTKRYAHTRISRILCQYFIGFDRFDTKAMRHSPSRYVRILGFNETGKKILKEMKKQSQIDIYTKLPSKGDEMLQLDLLSTSMYSLINRSIAPNSDYIISPIIQS